MLIKNKDNPYPEYIWDETCPGVKVMNPLYLAWEQGWEAHKQFEDREAGKLAGYHGPSDGAGGG